jgi:hypothetical protein
MKRPARAPASISFMVLFFGRILPNGTPFQYFVTAVGGRYFHTFGQIKEPCSALLLALLRRRAALRLGGFLLVRAAGCGFATCASHGATARAVAAARRLMCWSTFWRTAHMSPAYAYELVSSACIQKAPLLHPSHTLAAFCQCIIIAAALLHQLTINSLARP